MTNKSGYQPGAGDLNIGDPPQVPVDTGFTAIMAPPVDPPTRSGGAWIEAYLQKVRELVELDGYCVERHAAMGFEVKKFTHDLWAILEDGEPVVIIRCRDSKTAEIWAVACLAAIEAPLVQGGT